MASFTDSIKALLFVQKPAETKAALVPTHAPVVNIARSAHGLTVLPGGYSNATTRSAHNITFQAILTRIQSTASKIPWNVYKLRRDKNTDLMPDSRFANLIYNPNPKQSWSDFVCKFIGNMLTYGNVFIYTPKLDKGLNAGQAQQLWILPATTEVIIGDGVMDLPIAYRAELRPGKWTELSAEEVIHIKRYNAYDEVYGLSPLKTALLQITTLDAAMRQTLEHMVNGGPAIVISDATAAATDSIAVGANATSDEYKQSVVKTILGPEKLKYLDYKVNVQEVGPRLSELMVLDAINASEGKLADLLGYPAVLLSSTDGDKYANMDIASRMLYSDCVLPLLNELKDALNKRLGPTYSEKLYLDLDISGIEVLKRDQTKLITAANIGVALTMNERRSLIGIPEHPDADIFVFNKGERIVKDLNAELVKPALEAPEETPIAA